MKKYQLLGTKVNSLTIIEEDIIRDDVSVNHNNFCRCRCDCGDILLVERGKLINGRAFSCGCYNAENSKKKALLMNKAWTKYTPKEASARKIFKHSYSDGDLEFDDFVAMTQQPCFYCGAAPSNIANCFKHDKRANAQSIIDGDFVYSGIDRLNSNEPHNLNNCVPCCRNCNFIKRDMSYDEFKLLIKNTYKHLKI